MWEVGLPPSPVEFSSIRHSHKLSHSWLLGRRPWSHWTLSGRPACLLGRRPLPPLQCSECPTLFATCLYYSYCLLLSFSFFTGWRLVCPGGYAALAWVVCGSTMVLRSSPGPRLCKLSGYGQLAAQGPSWFLHLSEVEILCAYWRCGRVKVLPLLRGFVCKVCLQSLSKISL
jgi:hypothetical protein